MIDITDFNKDQLAEYAKNTFKTDLDLTKPLNKLIAEVKKMQASPKDDKPKAPENPKATHILNRNTGVWFSWTPELAKYLTNAVPCDENGNPV